MVPLKYLSSFLRTLEIPLIICEISIQLKWPRDCSLVAGFASNKNGNFRITDAKPYVPVVTLSIQNNLKLLKQLESGFERTIKWDKYVSKTTNQTRSKGKNKIIYVCFIKLFYFKSFWDILHHQCY